MKHRNLGTSGPLVSAIGLGCAGMSEFYSATDNIDQQAGIKLIQQAYELGITFFDTADVYGRGHNEILVGQAIQHFRDKIIVATKCGFERNGDDWRIDNSSEFIKKACNASLQRLGIQTIDLYYLHRHDPSMPIENVMHTMLELINENKIRYVGLSEVDAQTIERAHAVLGDKLVAVQSEYSIINHEDAERVLPICRKLGISFVAYSPLMKGLLSGTLRDTKIFQTSEKSDCRLEMPQFAPDNLPYNLKLVDALQTLAFKKNCTTAQLSLAWLLAQGDDIIPIPGTSILKYLKENIDSVNIHLTDNDLNTIKSIMQENPIKGIREA